MRTISITPLVTFFSIIVSNIFITIFITYHLHRHYNIWEFSEILFLAIFCLFFVINCIISYRLFFVLIPIPKGEIDENSKKEIYAMVYQLFQLFLWRPFFQSKVIPIPWTRTIYRMLGSKVGRGTYFPGSIGDPMHLKIGKNCILGEESLLIAHIIEGKNLAYYQISIGDNVTIGAKAIIMAGVSIENDAIIASGAIVSKNAHIKAGEIWGGVPAKYIKSTVHADTKVNELKSLSS